MKRRAFLAQASATAGALLPAAAFGIGEDRRGTDTVVVIADIGADTSLAGLEAVLSALIAENVPCLCVIDPAIFSDAPLMPDDPRAILLRRLWTDYAGLIELAPFVTDLERQRPYFQARLASLALIQLSETLDIATLIRDGRKVSTIACFGQEERISFDGLRSAGVRTVMSFPKVGALPLRNRVSPSNVLTVSGGRRVSILDPPDSLLTQQEAESHNILIFSAADFGQGDVVSLAAPAAQFARAAAKMELLGKGGVTQSRDILVRDGTAFRRQVAVHLCGVPSDNATPNAAVADFAAMLTKTGIAHSASVGPDQGMDAASLGLWVPDTGQPVVIDLPYVQTPETQGAGVTLILGRTNATWRGLDDAGNLHLPVSFEVAVPLREGKMARALGPVDDGVVLIHPSGVATPALQLSVLRALVGLGNDGVTDLCTLSDLVSTVLPPDPLLPVMQRTEAAAPAFLRRSGGGEQRNRDLLMEDARVAWRYFDNFTHKTTGLCQAAVSGSGSAESQYGRLTMWDIGSHINALIAAVDLGLIDEASFRARIKKVLRHLVGRKVSGAVLPPEEVIVATGRTTRNFNASDTGRLLSVLSRLAKHRFADFPAIQALVASWDLKDVVIDGKFQSISGGLLISAASSQYADYSAQGLAAWGIAAQSPYAGFAERGSADQKMTLLETLAQLGPFGAEPVLLKILDRGPDAASDYVADTLFAAMLADYEGAGRLVCPSETPIDQSPWFIYQGLQLGSADRPWRVVFDRDGEAIDESADTGRMALSCKAAYLWAAVIAHPHSNRLLGYVREKARDKVGFASCIYVDTGKATSNSTDINTNGIILQSIAAILLGPNSQ
ncbi:DUF3131 domain-containing protein [Pseudorhodobacter sp. W20_MBD10_FR17]|uniref:DUF3131 domain-containing protein n=1 Tax=Pseudorhodobacter sp. W20_MBD10_FR17 TaxID=3240266 RepID=UPI003F9D120C